MVGSERLCRENPGAGGGFKRHLYGLQTHTFLLGGCKKRVCHASIQVFEARSSLTAARALPGTGFLFRSGQKSSTIFEIIAPER